MTFAASSTVHAFTVTVRTFPSATPAAPGLYYPCYPPPPKHHASSVIIIVIVVLLLVVPMILAAVLYVIVSGLIGVPILAPVVIF